MIKKNELLEYVQHHNIQGEFNNNHLFFVLSSIDDVKKIRAIINNMYHISYCVVTDEINLLELYNLLNSNMIIYSDNSLFVKYHSLFDEKIQYVLNGKNDIQNINEYLVYHGITKVTNQKIYYRDINFKKCYKINTESNKYCYIETDDKTEFRSFDGKYLMKSLKLRYQHNEENTYEHHLSKSDIFYYRNIDNLSHSKMIRYMLFDIEDDMSLDIINVPKPITSISCYDNLTDKYCCLVLRHSKTQQIKQHEYAKTIIFDDEKKMLIHFFELLQYYDVLCGWNSENFDIPYTLNRAKKLGIKLENYFENLYLKINAEKIRIYQGNLIFYDAMKFYKMNVYYNKPPNYSLNGVSKFLFGNDVAKLEHQGVGYLWRNDINMLVNYNVQDVKLLKMICDRSNIINYPLQLQQFCPQDFENVFYNSKTIENLLHHRYYKKNIFFPSKIEHVKPNYEGAIVFPPVQGLHTNVAVLDFAAMYTNIYLSFNYSPDTLIGKKKYVEENFELIKNDLIKRYPEILKNFKMYNTKEDVLKQWILCENDFGAYYFLPKDWKYGILPKLEEEMLKLRQYYKNEAKKHPGDSILYKVYDELQGTAKTILNSIYGCVAFKKFILFNPIIPSSITATARKQLEWVKDKSLEYNNLRTNYGDTDSVFIEFPQELSFEDFSIQAKKLETYINNSFTDFMKLFTKNKYHLDTQSTEIEYEKGYIKLMLLNVKKQYFGLIKYYKGKILDKPKMSVTGLSTRRDDLPNFFKNILENTYALLLEGDDTKIKQKFKKIKEDIKSCPVEDLYIKMKMSKNPKDYANLPIHIRAVNNSKTTIRKGEIVNMIYVNDYREVLHHDESLNLKYQLDYDKYIENFFIKKIVLINDKFKHIFNNQTSLSKWF